MRVVLISGLASLLILSAGCATVQEVRGKFKAGPEFQHAGNSSEDSVRYKFQPGVEVKWSNGVTTGVSYRRRDIDEGNGNKDQTVYFDLSFPIWKAKPKEDRLTARIEQLEKALEAINAERAAQESN
ncbi:MAG: hypothetical protein JXO22_08200 [Phycisphaerae bacterium]|nr:hypothetical protein [Phycisphaerae bacterium]